MSNLTSSNLKIKAYTKLEVKFKIFKLCSKRNTQKNE